MPKRRFRESVRSERVWTYLKPYDLEYLKSLQEVMGFPTLSETLRFSLRLLRVVLPQSSLVSWFVREMFEEASKTPRPPQA